MRAGAAAAAELGFSRPVGGSTDGGWVTARGERKGTDKKDRRTGDRG